MKKAHVKKVRPVQTTKIGEASSPCTPVNT
jgi:hypothetical protein